MAKSKQYYIRKSHRILGGVTGYSIYVMDYWGALL